MPLTIGDTAPDFEAETTRRADPLPRLARRLLGVLFSHPKDFTPVCTTELGYMAKIKPEFDKRNVKIIGLSVDSTGDHERWAADIAETQGTAPNYPIIARQRLQRSPSCTGCCRPTSMATPSPHPGRQRHRAQRVRDRPGQEDQAGPGLPDDDRAQLRRGAAGRSTRCS